MQDYAQEHQKSRITIVLEAAFCNLHSVRAGLTIPSSRSPNTTLISVQNFPDFGCQFVNLIWFA